MPDLSSLAEPSGMLPETELPHLLLVGPRAATQHEWREKLSGTRWRVFDAQSGAAAWESLLEGQFQLMLLDPNLPDLDGGEFERMIRSKFPGLQIVVLAPPAEMTSPATVSTVAVPRVPESHARVVLRPEVDLQVRRSSSDSALDSRASWHELVGGSAAMRRVYHAGQLVARKSSTVLIQGESGTGKDLLARAIHRSSNRDKQPFVVINCAAIPETLLEAELFGYTKGAFTGAAQSKIGRIHAAHGGTLFLDEIGDMPLPLQSKILRFLEQGEVQRVGGTDTLKVDCRILAATNADLKIEVKEQRFREDLYYRLAVFPIHLPPLRERMEDLNALSEHLLSRLSPGSKISEEARSILASHDWPGNVRELRNVIERAAIYSDGGRSIEAEDVHF